MRCHCIRLLRPEWRARTGLCAGQPGSHGGQREQILHWALQARAGWIRHIAVENPTEAMQPPGSTDPVREAPVVDALRRQQRPR